MDSIPSHKRKRQRTQTGIDLEDLRLKLRDVDESSLEDLLAFKQALEAVVTSSSPNSIPTLAAAKLTRQQVFTYFGLQNNVIKRWGMVDYEITTFELQPEFDISPGGPSEWLTQSLERCSAVFARTNEADIRTFINLIIMDVMHSVQRFQADGIFGSEAHENASAHITTPLSPEPCESTRPTTPPPPSNRLICAYNEVQVSSTVQVDGKPIRITGRFDIGFGYGTPLGHTVTTHGGSFLDTYLAVLETKGIRCDFEAAFDQLLVYLAMVHHARANKLKHNQVKNGNSTVYGVLSDGRRFVFICLDNNSLVHQSPEFNILHQLPSILRYFRHCLAVVAASSPTSSPQTVRIAKNFRPGDRDSGDDGEVGSEDDKSCFEDLQRSVFRFQTHTYNEEDIVHWR